MILSRYLVAPVEQFAKDTEYSVTVEVAVVVVYFVESDLEVAVVVVYFVESDLEVARHSVGSDLLRTEHSFSASPDSTCHRTLSKSRNSDSVDTPSKSGRSICCWVVQLPVAEDFVVFVVLGSAAPVVDPEIARHSVVVHLSVVVTVPVHLLLR